MRLSSILLCMILFSSCNFSEEKEVVVEDKEEFVFDLYEPSEMSLLMNSMYDENEKIKAEIVSGNVPDEFHEDFMRIFTAELSESKYRNETFEAYSKVFIDNQKAIFDGVGQLPLEQRYNNAIKTCISCHTTECVGPIPRIEKLLIK